MESKYSFVDAQNHDVSPEASRYWCASSLQTIK